MYIIAGGGGSTLTNSLLKTIVARAAKEMVSIGLTPLTDPDRTQLSSPIDGMLASRMNLASTGHVPDYILCAKLDVKLGYIAGLVDACNDNNVDRGDVNAQTLSIKLPGTMLSKDPWMKDIQALLYSCGLQCTMDDHSIRLNTRLAFQMLSLVPQCVTILTKHARASPLDIVSEMSRDFLSGVRDDKVRVVAFDDAYDDVCAIDFDDDVRDFFCDGHLVS